MLNLKKSKYSAGVIYQLKIKMLRAKPFDSFLLLSKIFQISNLKNQIKRSRSCPLSLVARPIFSRLGDVPSFPPLKPPLGSREINRGKGRNRFSLQFGVWGTKFI